jgi:hypothetical protein
MAEQAPTLTATGGRESIVGTAEFYVNQATVPLGITVFTCACGATKVRPDLKRNVPSGWSTAADGSDRCPRCASSDRASESPKRR